MELKKIETMTRDDGKAVTTFYQADEYKVRMTVKELESGETDTRIDVVFDDYEDANRKYLPEIYYEDGFFRKDGKPLFKIQTYGYGSMTAEEMQRMLDGYRKAMEVVELLTKAFC